MPRGQFSSSTLAKMVADAGDGATFIIPKVVIWEWAEHAVSASNVLNAAARSSRVDELIITAPKIVPTPSIEEVIRKIERALPVGVEIDSPDEATWEEAIRQQILQIGMGEKKQAVKTGAADAIVAATIKKYSADSEYAVVVVSGDKKLREVAKIHSVIFTTGMGALSRALKDYRPATESVLHALLESLPAYLTGKLEDNEAGNLLDVYGYEFVVPSGGEIIAHHGPLLRLEITEVRSVEVEDVVVSQIENGWEGLVDVKILGTIWATTLAYEMISPYDEVATEAYEDLSYATVTVPMKVTWNSNWRLQEAAAVGPAVFDFRGRSHDGYEQYRVTPYGGWPA